MPKNDECNKKNKKNKKSKISKIGQMLKRAKIKKIKKQLKIKFGYHTIELTKGRRRVYIYGKR